MTTGMKRRARVRPPRPRTTVPPSGVTSSDLPYNVTVGDVMSGSPLTIGMGASLYDALVLMRTNGITGLPVVGRDGELEGVVSERDLAEVLGLRTTLRGLNGMMDVLLLDLKEEPEPTLQGFRERLEETEVADIVSQPPLTVPPEATLERAMELMTERSIHRLPVVHEGRLVGVISTHDLLRAVLPLVRRAQ
jgi:CBS domain-containing protein